MADVNGVNEDNEERGKVWTKPTMRVLVAGYFGGNSTDGLFRGGYYEGVDGVNYPPSVNPVYQNPSS